MQINDLVHGFKVKNVRESKETGSTAYNLIHEKSGAEVFYLKNNDENKAFGIGFNTPPEDSSGVPHIVEHCVLSGSEKFKTREPFMELAKSSMATFLNAMTFSDMTIYPISSMNEEDFMNLMNVYLDAVLFPQIYSNKKIFMQEGWHYELLKEEDDITYKGVVYNEMKGAYSSPERQVISQIMQNSNPDTTYSHESGGYPYAIPQLTYENFLDFHKKYYHPSNGFIYLYGNMDIEKTLKFIDDEYLSRFTKKDYRAKSVILPIKEGQRKETFYYSADEEDKKENKSYLSYTVNIGNVTSKIDSFMNMLLSEVLLNSESSPIRIALLENKIGEDLLAVDSDSYYLNLSMIAKNADSARIDEFTNIIEDTLKKIIKDGFDKNLLMAALNKTEMRLREAHGSLRGIIYFISTIGNWRYGVDPLDSLSFDDTFKELREKIEEGYFEKYVEEKILNNKSKFISIHEPKAGIFKKEDEDEKERLRKYKESLSKEEIATLIKENEELIAFQTTEDSKEDKNTIPHLNIKNISQNIADIEENRMDYKDAKIFTHTQNTTGISYISAVFPLDHLKEDEIIYVSYLSNILGIVDTKNFKYTDLNNEILKNTSGINFSGEVFKNTKDYKKYTPRFIMSSSAIGDNWKKIFELAKELINNTLFDNGARLLEVLNTLRSSMEMSFDGRGNALVMSRLKSFFSNADKYNDFLGGIGFYDNLNNLIANFEESKEVFIEKLKEVYKKVFNGKDVLISITSEEERIEEITEASKLFLDTLNHEVYERRQLTFDLKKNKEALTSASNVQYVSKGYNLIDLGYKSTGELVVLKNLLSMDYLHNAIRARGGAYGAGIGMEITGEVATYSYRDPNLKNTVEAYDGMGNFLREGKFDEDDVRNFIIGSMTSFNPPIAPSDVNSIMISRYFRETTKEDIEIRLKEALGTDREKLMGYADMMDALMKEDYLVVYGNKAKIESEKELFTEIRPLKK